jgi:hypothetical protein
MPQETCPPKPGRYIPSLSKARELAPAFPREAPSRIAQTPPFFRGSELQLRQKTAARNALLSRCSSRESSLSRLSNVREIAPAFAREATSRIAQTPPLFRGSELQLRQKTAARSASLSRCSSRELSLSRLAPLERGGLPPLCRRMPQVTCPPKRGRYIPSLSKARELAPAFTREAPSRIAEPPSFRGSELQLRQKTAARSACPLRRAFLSRCSSRELWLSLLSKARELAPAFTREAPSRIAETPPLFRGSELQLRQKTPARSAFLSRCSSRESSLSRLSKAPELAPAFAREAPSRIAQTPPFALIYFPLSSLTANAFFTLGQISRLKIISAAESWGAFRGPHPFIPVIMDTFSYSSPRSTAQPD